MGRQVRKIRCVCDGCGATDNCAEDEQGPPKWSYAYEKRHETVEELEAFEATIYCPACAPTALRPCGVIKVALNRRD